MTEPVGQVLGTQDAMPLEFWLAVAQRQYVELDDVVVVRTALPDGQTVTLYGTVDVVKARHEGVAFDSDVFQVTTGVLPAGISQSAHVAVTRIEPEIYVPPLPGQPVERARGAERGRALFRARKPADDVAARTDRGARRRRDGGSGARDCGDEPRGRRQAGGNRP